MNRTELRVKIRESRREIQEDMRERFANPEHRQSVYELARWRYGHGSEFKSLRDLRHTADRLYLSALPITNKSIQCEAKHVKFLTLQKQAEADQKKRKLDEADAYEASAKVLPEACRKLGFEQALNKLECLSNGSLETINALQSSQLREQALKSADGLNGTIAYYLTEAYFALSCQLKNKTRAEAMNSKAYHLDLHVAATKEVRAHRRLTHKNQTAR